VAWRAARSLLKLQRQLQKAAPKAAPRKAGTPGQVGADEWGLIGDPAHTTGDHLAKNFPGWGNQIVTAGDFPNRPDLGLDAHQVLDDIRRSRDARVKYGISNGQIYSSYAVSGYGAWTWRPYNPKNGDKHFTHGHLSVVGDARADGEQDWQTIGRTATTSGIAAEDEDDMGASFPPIAIEREGITSITLPAVQGGVADPRRAWLRLCNATGDTQYKVRVFLSKGQPDVWEPLAGDRWTNGERLIKGGELVSVELPKDTTGLDVRRVPVKPGGDVYPGHLTLEVERGPVVAPVATPGQ